MKIDTDELGQTVLYAEAGMALCRKDEKGPTETTIVYLGKYDSPNNWKDCELKVPDETDENAVG